MAEAMNARGEKSRLVTSETNLFHKDFEEPQQYPTPISPGGASHPSKNQIPGELSRISVTCEEEVITLHVHQADDASTTGIKEVKTSFPASTSSSHAGLVSISPQVPTDEQPMRTDETAEYAVWPTDSTNTVLFAETHVHLAKLAIAIAVDVMAYDTLDPRQMRIWRVEVEECHIDGIRGLPGVADVTKLGWEHGQMMECPPSPALCNNSECAGGGRDDNDKTHLGFEGLGGCGVLPSPSPWSEESEFCFHLATKIEES